MVVSPAIQSITPARRGRGASVELLPEQVEGHLYGVLTELVPARAALRERLPAHDAAADAAVASVLRIAHGVLAAHADANVRLAARAIKAFCAAYQTADALEDAEAEAAAVRVERAAFEGRAGCALIEFRSSGRQRGRLPRRMTKAAQPTLIEVES